MKVKPHRAGAFIPQGGRESSSQAQVPAGPQLRFPSELAGTGILGVPHSARDAEWAASLPQIRGGGRGGEEGRC